MKSIFLILPFTSKALEIISNEYRSTLGVKNIIIFMLSGLILYLPNLAIEEVMIDTAILLLTLKNIAVAIAISVVLGLVVSFIIHRLGKWLGGIAEEIDIESTYAHSLIPVMIATLLVVIARTDEMQVEAYNNGWFRNGILYVGMLFQFKILLQGIQKFNQLSWLKSVLTISPIILFKILHIVLAFYLITKIS